MLATTALTTTGLGTTAPWMILGLLLPAVATFCAAVASQRTATIAQSWKMARAATTAMFLVGLGAVGVRAAGAERANTWVRLDTVGVTMLVLVSLVGWVIVRYSQAYLAGDPHERSYVGRLLATLTSVSVVVITNHLVMLMVAWMATSLVLHGLLTFYRNRPVAIAVAHKKFILARCADIALLGAVVAFGTSLRTLRIDEIAARAGAAASLPVGARVGVALVALAALLKCAQLPFHGWLLQVMEAPTPVSALLHAGVVNLGGFVLLRFAPVVDRAVETRTLLVVVGTTTAVIAAVVMTTRISVKVALAWSTCAQMGFMLMQCGLGLWEMALLHLVAHSLYKAHAFLGAGGVVRQTQRKQLLAKAPVPSIASVGAGLAVAFGATVAARLVWDRLAINETSSTTMWILSGIVAASMVPLLSGSGHRTGATVRITSVATTFAVAFTYFGLHALVGQLVPHGSRPPVALLAFVAVAFVGLFATQTLCLLAPSARLVRRMYPWVYGGLFIDEAFTRVAFRLWPPPRTSPSTALLPERIAAPLRIVWSEPGHPSSPGPASSSSGPAFGGSHTLKPTVLDRSLA